MAPTTDFQVNDWRVSPRLNRLFRGNDARHVEPKAMDLLVFLAQDPGRVVSKEEIIETVWEGRIIADSALSRVIADLRRALEDDVHDPKYIETIPKRGYRLIADTQPAGQEGTEARERKRIVVLPFQSLGSLDEAGFGAGITEEITTRLASVSELAVISCQSARSCAQRAMTVREIARELSVQYILEGSVRWDGNATQQRFRISPQLIRAADDTHLWAASYEGVLQDIFTIQIEIAQEVLDHLDVTLREAERSVFLAARTDNIEAYKAYLRGLSYTLRPDFWSRESMRVIVRSYEQAVDLDPSFATAHAALAAILSAGFWIGLDRSPERLERAKSALDRALEIDPDLPLAYFALGHYHAAHRDYERAVEALERAVRGLPSESELFRALGLIHRYMGNWPEAVRQGGRALELNPRDPRIATSLGYTHTLLRSYDEADDLYRRSLDIQPDQMSTYIVKTLNHWFDGDLEGARKTLESMPAAEHPSALVIRWQQELLERDFAAALAHLEASALETIEDYLHLVPKSQLLGTTLALMGDAPAAADAFESAQRFLARRLAERAEDARAHSSLGLVLAGLGNRKEAIQRGLRAVELVPVSEDAVSGPVQLENLASIYVLTGEFDAAAEQLELLLSIPAPFSAAMLRLDPRWDALRDHPRFHKLAGLDAEG